MSETHLIDRVRELFPEAIIEVQRAHDELTLVVRKSALEAFMHFLFQDTELAFNYLVDVTAVDYQNLPEISEKFQARFMVVYHLYSHQNNVRVRIKTPLEEDEAVPSVATLWKAANWLEREVYDMFGIVFEGHPDLCRILMPDDYEGHPLRKDYPLRGRGERARFLFDTGNQEG